MKTDYIVKHSCEMTREDKLEMEFVETIFAIRIKEKDVSEMAIVNRCYNPEDVDFHEISFFNDINATNFVIENPQINGKVEQLDVYSDGFGGYFFSE